MRVPAAVNYPSPLTAVPSLMQDEPVEGRKQVPVEILWGSMGGPNKAVAFNLQDNATLNISQISTLKVDNSASGADVQFIFPDTSDTITIPAGTPLAVVPVFSNSIQFYVVAPAALASDVTRFQVMNYKHDPADVPAVAARQTASVPSAGLVPPGSIQIIPAGVSGTLETLQIDLSRNSPTTSANQIVITITDGAGNNLIANANYGIATGQAVNRLLLVNLDDLNWRFTNGLKVTFAAAGGADTFIANAFATYEIP